MSPAAIVACANHGDREAIGICVRCKKRVCGECTTKVDGINHCVACFEALAAPAETAASRTREPALVSLALALIGLAVAVLSAWAMLELALPGGG